MIASQGKISAFVNVYQNRKARAFGCNRNFYLTKRLDGFRTRNRSLPLPPGYGGRYALITVNRRSGVFSHSSVSRDFDKWGWIWH